MIFVMTKQELEIIRFYRVRDNFGCFSNFALYPFELDGKLWRTSEHYFQAQKFLDEEYREKIRTTASPMIAARLGRSRAVPIVSEWNTMRDEIMRRALRAKFYAHEVLRETLIDTGNAVLVEHTKNDRYWGDGGDGTGKNMLGILLMELRDELRNLHS
jgi:ribA/ribD-fused uncharacterized protein